MNVKVAGISLLLLMLCVFMAIMTAEPWYSVGDSTFLKPNNIENLLRRTSLYGILGIGVAFVIISSGIDLSIGSVVCLSGSLLAIFLNVEYRAFDSHEIWKLDAGRNVVVVAGDVTEFEVGDQIRYSGGRRARTGIFTIESVEQTQVGVRDGEPDLANRDNPSGPTRAATLIKVTEPLGSNDRYGQIATANPILAFEPGTDEGSQLTLGGQHPALAVRDQLALVHPESGLSQPAIASAEVVDETTVVRLRDSLNREISTEWLAIPLERRQRLSVPAALAAVLGIALALGLVHGLLITRVRLQPFVVTLCGLLIYRGIARWLVSDQPVGFGNEFESTLSPLGAGKWTLLEWSADGRATSFGLPYPLFVLIFAAIAAAIFLNKTIWGRYLLALGRNEEAARYSGINTARVTMTAYVISTLAAATGGILFALDANSISPSSFGNFFELYAIAAAVLGGCSLRGGEGSIIGVIIGTAVMQVLYNLIVLMQISGTLESTIIGSVILIGVMIDELLKRSAARRV